MRKFFITVSIMTLGLICIYAEENDGSPTNVQNNNTLGNNNTPQSSILQKGKIKSKNSDTMQEIMPESILKIKYPDEYKEVIKLRKSAPEKAKVLWETLNRKGLADYKAEKLKVKELVEEYKKNNNPQILSLLRAKVAEKYNIKLEQEKIVVATREAKLKKDEEKLAKKKAKIQNHAAKKDETIDNIVKELCKEHDITWPM